MDISVVEPTEESKHERVHINEKNNINPEQWYLFLTLFKSLQATQKNKHLKAV